MLTVIISSSRMQLARIEIENVTPRQKDHADYSVRFAVGTGAGLGIYQRRVENFPRKRYNALALLRLALSALEEKDLTLDADPDARHSPDLGRGLD